MIGLLGAAAALTGCGGGGASGPSPLPPPPAPAALSGTIDGLVQIGLVLKNGAETISPAANATSFSFTTLLPYNTAYAVTVQQQPAGQSCQVSNGSGMSGVTTATIVVSCAGIQWTWLGGSNTPNAPSVYGTKGVASATSIPGARAAGVRWTDSSGKMWIFGGYGNDSASTGYLSDLWRYDPQSGQWAWMGGPSTADSVGTYGTKGTADPGNSPGGRNYAASWTDSSGTVWIFGGKGYGSSSAARVDLNDLWKYDPGSGTWTWVSGSNTGNTQGVYGTLNVAANTNMPGAREGASAWVNGSVLWLFGGYGYDSAGVLNVLNDLWKYDPQSGQWTWMGGDSQAGGFGVYGTRLNAAPANHPGARAWSVTWKDVAGNYWLFGGNGNSSASNGALNDLWKLDAVSLEWAWVSGADAIDASGIYGNKGVASATNFPGGRDEAVGWRDSAGILWLYGGNGLDSVGAHSSLNDLWKYDAMSDQWTWVSGSTMADAPGVYGTRGAAAANNVPGARQLGATWVDANNTLWLFGGYGYDSTGGALHYLNELWFVVPN